MNHLKWEKKAAVLCGLTLGLSTCTFLQRPVQAQETTNTVVEQKVMSAEEKTDANQSETATESLTSDKTQASTEQKTVAKDADNNTQQQTEEQKNVGDNTPDGEENQKIIGFHTENGKTFYYDSSGVKTTGWQYVEGNWYYLDPNTSEMVSAEYIGDYWVCKDGIWRSGIYPRWQKNSIGWRYGDDYGWYATNAWELINGAWYWFDGNGYMVTGWKWLNGKWYYMNSSGMMVTGWQYINGSWYYMDSSGAMLSATYTGGYWLCRDGIWRSDVSPRWLKNSVGWWYGDGYGWYIANDWRLINGSKYWFDENGYMATGWRKIKETWFYLSESGAMLSSQYVNGWKLNQDGTWTEPNRASWRKNNVGWWYGDNSGWYAANSWERIDNEWYYFDQNGYMVTGWRWIGNSWYYFNGSGYMLHDTWVQGKYYLNTGGDMDNVLTIVLDPGHGGSDGGASAFGVSEKNLNLKIALACRDELETYKGVRVFMTRTEDVAVNLSWRSEYAKSVDPSAVLVSIHNNAGHGKGSEVLVQNNHYNTATAAVTQGLGYSILGQLTALGLKNDGIIIRDSDDSYYPDGSVADWYSINRVSKRNGVPGLIVEHAYIDNASDYTNYLSTDAKLRQLGISDARGIAQYFGLSK